jgi:glycosyltransferase involved in cell wall biosynthesis
VRVILDGSVVYDRSGAAYKWFAHVVPLLGTSFDVRLLPAPTGVLDFLMPAAPARRRHPIAQWIPDGAVRRWLSRQLQRARAKRRFEAAGVAEGDAVFQSWFYTHPPTDSVTQLQTVHDMIPERFPEAFTEAHDFEFRKRKLKCIREAARIIAVSENTKRDLMQLAGVAADRIDVVPQGVDLEFFGAADVGKAGLNRPYFLQVGGRMKHKNFLRLLEAFAHGKFARDYLLVCAGEWLQPDEKALMAKLGIEHAVRHVHWPDEDKLRSLMRDAAALAYPSSYEGFGMPPLEAMACGTPVCVANVSSMPEVCGEAAEYFDPTNPADLARAMARALEPAHAKRLREAGRARAALFPWSRTARETLATYRRIEADLRGEQLPTLCG